MANSIHVGTDPASLTDLSGASYGVTLLKTAWPWMATPSTILQNLPERDGGSILVNSFRMRSVSFPLRIEGTSNSDLLSKIEEIHKLIDPRLGLIYVKADVWSDRLFYGRFSGPWQAGYRGQLVTTVTAPFTSQWAETLSTTETTQTETVSASPEAFTVPAAGTVDGSGPALPQWIIKNTSGSASGAIKITNGTTAETFSLPTTASIPNGTWLRLDRERWTVETSTDSGSTWTAAPSLVGAGKNIPRINPGVSNSCTLTNLSSGSIDIVYRARFI